MIDGYLEKNLKLRRNEAAKLHQDYVQDYGLAIGGLVRYHHIDPMEFNSQVDDALPLESIIEPRPQLKKLFSDIDRKKVKLWLFTNAYKTHAQRVVKILEIDDFFDGLTYCDYSSVPFLCKPQKSMYLKAMREAGVQNMKDCFFVGK